MKRREFFKTNLAAVLGLSAFGFAPKIFGQKTKPGAVELKTGGVKMIPVDGGKYRVWTKKIGKGNIKMLLLHGGPGATHEYFECFEDFLPAAGIEFYYYDQLDSHYSDQPNDEKNWTIERYTEEVEQVRKALGLEKFYLLGSSWGGMLAIEYALKYQQHLKGLIISNMTASVKDYEAYAQKLRAELPADVLAILDKYESKGDYGNPEYQETMLMKVYTKHLCRVLPFPDPVERTFKHFNEKIYNYIQGPNEFVITGTMKNWDRWADLPKIKTPTLCLGARYDEMNPADMKRESELIPNARLAICPNGSHMAMWDDQQTYFANLLKFVRDVERGVKI